MIAIPAEQHAHASPRAVLRWMVETKQRPPLGSEVDGPFTARRGSDLDRLHERTSHPARQLCSGHEVQVRQGITSPRCSWCGIATESRLRSTGMKTESFSRSLRNRLIGQGCKIIPAGAFAGGSDRAGVGEFCPSSPDVCPCATHPRRGGGRILGSLRGAFGSRVRAERSAPSAAAVRSLAPERSRDRITVARLADAPVGWRAWGGHRRARGGARQAEHGG